MSTLQISHYNVPVHDISNIITNSVAEPELHLLVGAGAVTRSGSGSDCSCSDNGIKHGWALKNDSK
jgi:hypothetical protein